MAKYEQLCCLIPLIFEDNWAFYAIYYTTLYKVIVYLTEDDWNKRKLELKTYFLNFYYIEEIMS